MMNDNEIFITDFRAHRLYYYLGVLCFIAFSIQQNCVQRALQFH